MVSTVDNMYSSTLLTIIQVSAEQQCRPYSIKHNASRRFSVTLYRIYTVITHANGSYVPLAFFLLPDKKEKKPTKLSSNTGNMENKTIHLDFEKAAHEAVKYVLPTFAIRGCLFHLKQSW